jgi:hypothetical protein
LDEAKWRAKVYTDFEISNLLVNFGGNIAVKYHAKANDEQSERNLVLEFVGSKADLIVGNST